jgi:hypothetical protein
MEKSLSEQVAQDIVVQQRPFSDLKKKDTTTSNECDAVRNGPCLPHQCLSWSFYRLGIEHAFQV